MVFFNAASNLELRRPSPAPTLGLGQVLKSPFSLLSLLSGPVKRLFWTPNKSATNDYIYLKIAKA